MSKWKVVGKIGLFAAKAVFPAVAAVEAGVLGLKHAKGIEKLHAAEELALGSIELAEDLSDKELLNTPKVREAYRQFISSYVAFQNALAAAQEATSSP